jgi:hypothetical protein
MKLRTKPEDADHSHYTKLNLKGSWFRLVHKNDSDPEVPISKLKQCSAEITYRAIIPIMLATDVKSANGIKCAVLRCKHRELKSQALEKVLTQIIRLEDG